MSTEVNGRGQAPPTWGWVRVRVRVHCGVCVRHFLKVGVDEAFREVLVVLTFGMKDPSSSHVLYYCFSSSKKKINKKLTVTVGILTSDI